MDLFAVLILFGVIAALGVTLWGLVARQKSVIAGLIAATVALLAGVCAWYAWAELNSLRQTIIFGVIALVSTISSVRQFLRDVC
jgi:hypothetical protein